MRTAPLRAAALAAALLLLPLSACREPAEQAPATDAAPADAVPADAAAADSPMLDPDVATREELLALEGVDEATADAIVAGRPWADMVAVDAALAAHLDEAQRESLYGRLWKPIDLNAAGREEILLIPGVGESMAHEFEEYRPYRGIEEFRREIGKYVDDAEVARLERYVRVPDGAGA